MKKFNYSLAGVLKVRKIQEDQAKAILSQLIIEKDKLKEKVDELNREMYDCRIKLNKPGVVNATDFIQNEHYLQGLTKTVKKNIEKIQLMEIKIENQKKDLRKKAVETRKLEIHKDHEKESWHEEVIRKEQADFDDIASTRRRFLDNNN